MNTRLQEMNMLKDVTIAVSSNGRQKRHSVSEIRRSCAGVGWGRDAHQTVPGMTPGPKGQQKMVGVNGVHAVAAGGEGMGRCQAKE